MHILVIGCGISGLSCGIRLLEAGHSVQLQARELPPHTTSNIAAAIWYPYRAFPQERVNAWAQRTYEVLCELATQPEAGIRLVPGIEALRKPTPDPWWHASVPDFRRARPDELPPEYVDGYAFKAPVAEMSHYLPFLIERFQRLGGTLVQGEVRSLEDAWAQAPMVVNCTGLGARDLVGDTSLVPIRGEVLRVAPLPVCRFLIDDEEDEAHRVAYVIPRSSDVILGGTAEEGSWSLAPNPSQATGILARTSKLLLAGTQVRVLQHLVGLRPGRPTVRLEAERVRDRVVIHNYGHGGAGVTLSWGCAEEVVALVASA